MQGDAYRFVRLKPVLSYGEIGEVGDGGKVTDILEVQQQCGTRARATCTAVRRVGDRSRTLVCQLTNTSFSYEYIPP